MSNALEIRHLTKTYSGFMLKDLSISVPEGSVMGFIGENGAGKTTVIQLILDVIQRDSGKITVFGKDNIEHGPEIREQIGTVFDECYFPGDFHTKDLDAVFSRIYSQWDSPVSLS